MLGIAKYPDAFYLHKNLGQAYYNTAKFDLALNQYDRTIMLKPDYSDAYFFRGMTKMNLTKYEAAISDFNNSIRLDVQNGQAYYFRGLMYSKLSKNIEAKVDYNKSLELGYKGVPYNE
jgi:tetratricopeptide (TPR) repeat protein